MEPVVTDKVMAKEIRLHIVVRFMFGLSLALMGAALFTLAFPPYHLWPLAFIWMIPVMVAVHRVMPARFSGLALGVGIGGFFWGYFGGMFEGHSFMQYLPLFIGIIAALIGSRERLFHGRTNYRWFVLQGAVIWVGIEVIRGAIPVVGTWGFAAYSLYNLPWFIQPVSIFSIYGMSLIIMLVNFALAQLVLSWIDQRWSFGEKDSIVNTGHALRWLGGVGIILLVWGVLSLSMYRSPEPEVIVAAVQPAVYISQNTDENKIKEGLELIGEQTHQAAEKGARFIVWPEGFLPFDPQEKETVLFKKLAKGSKAYLAIGYAVDTEEGLRNESTIISPEGEFLGFFGKDHPVAFAGETSITRGTYPVHDTTIGKLGTIICYDADFTDTTRKIASNGVEIIGVPSYDWPAIAHKHYSHIVFRAVENRVAMIKADIAFDSAIIDPYGNIIERYVTAESGEALLVGGVSLGNSNTLNMKLGDWVGWISLAGMVFFIGLDIYTASNVKRRIKKKQ